MEDFFSTGKDVIIVQPVNDFANIIEVEPVLITAANCNDPALYGNYGVPHNEVWPKTQEIFDFYKWPGDEKIYNK